MCIRLENKISAIYHQPVATQLELEDFVRFSVLLIALIGSCFISTTVPIPIEQLKGNELECQMAASQWTTDGKGRHDEEEQGEEEKGEHAD